MATVIISSIGTGRDYATLAAWITAKAGNFVSLDVIHKAEVYDDGVFNGAVNLTGATTDATHYWWIAPAAGYWHNGVPGSGIELTSTTSIITISNAAIIEGLELRNWGSNDVYTAYHAVSITANVMAIIRKCLIHDRYLSGNYGRGSGIYCGSLYYSSVQAYNNIIYGISSAESARNYGIYQVPKVYNNTLVGCKVGIYSASNIVVAINNITQGGDDGFNGAFHADSDYNLSSIASDAPGSHSQNGVSLTFHDAANKNYHLASTDSAAIDDGTSLSSYFTDDIDGQTRSTWDIGADEYVSAAVTKTVTESGSGADALSGLLASLALSENGSGADGLQNLACGLGIAETGSGNDLLGSLQAQISLAETAAAAEILGALVALLMDESVQGDDGSLNIGCGFGIADTGAINDTIAYLTTLALITDNASGNDIIELLIQAFKSVLDEATGGDELLNVECGLGISESGTGADLLLNVACGLTIAENGTGADLIQVLMTALIAILEQASGSDESLNVDCGLGIAESGTGADGIPGVECGLTIADGGAGADLVQLLAEALKVITEAGMGSDTISSLQAMLAMEDAGSGAELISILSQVLLNDAGLSAENIQTLIGLVTIAEQILSNDTLVIDRGLILDAVRHAFRYVLKKDFLSKKPNSQFKHIVIKDFVQGADQC